MIAAMTPGTAYGTKNARRKNFLPRSSGESSSRANSSARPSMTGTCTMPNSSTRPTEVQNGSFWNTSTYCVSPPKTSCGLAEGALALDDEQRLPDGVADREQVEEHEQDAERCDEATIAPLCGCLPPGGRASPFARR